VVRQLVKKDAYSAFEYALKAPETKRQWPRRLDVFLTFLQLEGADVKERSNNLYDLIKTEGIDWLESHIIDFIYFQKQRVLTKEITETTINNYIKPLKTFCDMNNIILNWKYIRKGVPKGRKSALDRIPEVLEVKKLLHASDIRLKPIISVMLSSGIRVGAWDELKWKHIIPIKDEKRENIIAAKLIVYPGDEEEYYTFITPEAWNYLKEWMDFRASHGENITGESWLMRDIWQITDLPTHGGMIRLASRPQKLSVGAIKNIVYRALRSQQIIKKLDKENGDGCRHEFKMMHGFRKAFKTICENAGMKSINIELILGHNIGVSGSYYKPTEKDILQDYLRAVDFLTISEENKLSKKIKELSDKTKVQEYVINGKLQEKDEQINNLQNSIKFLTDKFNAFLISQPGNNIVYDDDENNLQIKGIELDPEIQNKAIGQVKISDKKK
jgi:integrase